MLKDFLTMQALIMFALGVFFSAWVKMLYSQAKGKVAG